MAKKRVQINSSLIAITPYPDRIHGVRDLNALAWHAKKTLRPLSRNKKIYVLSERVNGERNFKDGKNIKILRVWKKNSYRSFFKILKESLKIKEARNILISFEFGMFGGFGQVILLPILLAFLKIFGKKVFFEAHEVLLDISQLQEHINIKNKFLQKIINLGLLYFYFSVGLFSEKVIVFEASLKERLEKIVSSNKIEVLSLAVEPKKTISKAVARRKLKLQNNDFIALVFGFVNWYKGSDWVVSSFSKSKSNGVKLLLAGGIAPTLKNKGHYMDFYKQVKKDAKTNKNIIHTGFVPDEKVHLYFSAADIVVLPYRVFMAGSGPFSLSLSYKKPLILSEKLQAYSQSVDFFNSQINSNLQKEDLFFKLTKTDLMKLLKKTRDNKNLYVKLEDFVNHLAIQRSEKEVIKKYSSLLKNASIKPTYLPLYPSFDTSYN